MDHQNMNNGSNQQSVFSITGILQAALKRKGIVIAFFITVVGVVTIVSLLTPHVFQATSKLLVKREIDTEKALLLRMNSLAGANDYNWISSEIAIIKSYPVAERVVKKLSLYKQDKVDSSVTPGATLLQESVEAFQENLAVNNARESNLLAINYEAEDPKLAVKVVNEVIKVYMSYRSELYRDIEGYEFFESQMKIADSNLRELERKEADFKTQAEIISPESQRLILINRLSDYDRRITEIKTQRINKETRLAVIHGQLAKSDNISIPITESSDSPSRVNYISRLKGEVMEMEIAREKLLQEYTAEYSEVVNLEEQITAARKRIIQEVKDIVDEEVASVEAIRAQEKTLKELMEETRAEVSELAQKEFELSQINRGIEDSREIYSLLLKQREEARISLAKIQQDVTVKVLSPAVAGINPVRPNKRLNVMLAALFGLFGGVTTAFVLSLFDTPVKPREDLSESGVNILGTVGESK